MTDPAAVTPRRPTQVAGAPLTAARPAARPDRLRGVRWIGVLGLLGLAGLQASCIVVPQTREVYDADCRMLTRQMTLGTAVLGTFQSCAGDACAAMLAAAGAVTAASAVISGSIALVGNVVYWFERQGQCVRQPGVQPSSTISAPAPP